MTDHVQAVRAAVDASDSEAITLLLHPYLHWTDAAGATTRGRTNVLALLTARTTPLAAPVSTELRDDQIYRWTEPPIDASASPDEGPGTLLG